MKMTKDLKPLLKVNSGHKKAWRPFYRFDNMTVKIGVWFWPSECGFKSPDSFCCGLLDTIWFEWRKRRCHSRNQKEWILIIKCSNRTTPWNSKKHRKISQSTKIRCWIGILLLLSNAKSNRSKNCTKEIGTKGTFCAINWKHLNNEKRQKMRMPWRLYFLKNTFLHKYFYIIKSSYFRFICLFLKFFRRLESFWRHLEMPKSFKIKKTYAKDQRHDACLRKIAFFNYEMENNIIMGMSRAVLRGAILFMKSMSKRNGSDIERHWIWMASSALDFESISELYIGSDSFRD